MLVTVDCGNTRATFALIDLNAVTWPQKGADQAWPGLEPRPPVFLSVANPLTPEGVDVAWQQGISQREQELEVVEQEVEALVIGSVNPQAAQAVEGWVTTYLNARRSKPVAVLRVGDNLEIPIINRTAQPQQVGQDRLLNALACRFRYPSRAVVVVDFGTAITFDIVGADGAYLGGVITPGVSMSLTALHERTALLPVIEPPRERVPAIGRDTRSALLSGAYYGFPGLIEGVLRALKREFDPPPVVVSTGGDTKLIEAELPPNTFEERVPLLTHEGLLLTYHENQRDRASST